MAVNTRKPKGKVAAGVAYARMLQGLTQEGLAAEMRRFTGDDQWRTQRIISIENGRKSSFTAEELTALAEVLEVEVGFLVGGRRDRGWYGDADMRHDQPELVAA